MAPLGGQDFLNIASGVLKITATQCCEWEVTGLGSIKT